MTVVSFKRGHPIVLIGCTWCWADTEEPCDDDERPCVRCQRMPTPEGHDACLGTLEGVINACCGHGVQQPYTQPALTEEEIHRQWRELNEPEEVRHSQIRVR